jgi:hypothetical protein
MDRDRLKEIQTADLSESNVNEDFVQWLKTKGPTYLLIVMVVIAAYMFFVRYQQGEKAFRAEAWIEYIEASAAGLPASHEDVAQSYAEIDSLQNLGLLSAADGYLQSVIANQTVGSNANITTILTAEDRTFYLAKADALYARVIESDDQTSQSTLFVIAGLNGRAAVAESTGELDTARGFYELIITRATNQYPALGTQAERRISTLDVLAEAITLPSDAEVTARNNQILQRDPAPINSTIDAITDLTETGQ